MTKNVYYKYGITCLEAKRIVRQMRSVIDDYGYVTVADFYDLIGEKEFPYRCSYFGWRKLNHVRYRLGVCGITFEFPPLIVLK